jgi:hypothetical protein
VRLLLKVQHRKNGATTTSTGGGSKSGKGVIAEEPTSSEKVTFKRFATSYDHILLTVQGSPRQKEFVNGNTSGVWKKR